MANRIFINYRRDDAAPWAGRVYERLTRDFRKSQLFIDVDNIPPGMDFVKVLDEQVAKCDVLLAIIGKDWLSATNQKGVRRIDDPDDFVRIEIESALNRDIYVVPVIVGDAEVPAKDDLPASLQLLARRQAWRLSHNGFGPESDGLCRALKNFPSRRPGLFARTKAMREAFDFSQYAGAITTVTSLVDETQKTTRKISALPFWPKLGANLKIVGKCLAVFYLGLFAVLGLTNDAYDPLLYQLGGVACAAGAAYLSWRWWPSRTNGPSQQQSTAPSGKSTDKAETALGRVGTFAKILAFLALAFGFVAGIAGLDSPSAAPAPQLLMLGSAIAFVFLWRRWVSRGKSVKPETAAVDQQTAKSGTEPPAIPSATIPAKD